MWNLVLTIVGAYLLLVLLAFLFQSRLLYLPNLPGREVSYFPSDIGLDYEPVSITTSDNENLDGWFVPAAGARFTVLFFHGNAGNISHRLESIRIFHELGLDVLIIDYRGYGRSSGRPTEQGTYRDAQAAWRYLTEQRGIDADCIVLFGRSLGGSIAAWLAAEESPAALIVESGFTDAPRLAGDVYPFLPGRWLTRFRYRTADYLGRVRCPVLVVHSRADEIIPFRHGERLFAAAGEPKQFLELRGGHNDGFYVSGSTYPDGLRGFIAGLPEPPVAP